MTVAPRGALWRLTTHAAQQIAASCVPRPLLGWARLCSELYCCSGASQGMVQRAPGCLAPLGLHNPHCSRWAAEEAQACPGYSDPAGSPPVTISPPAHGAVGSSDGAAFCACKACGVIKVHPVDSPCRCTSNLAPLSGAICASACSDGWAVKFTLH